jgi:23S rRNA pseudouridine955/2504/2580 synthase/23S rRNA pseudouridine1911/1915/1917 synthase
MAHHFNSSPEVLFQDENIIAVNKPSGWLSIPDRHDAELSSVKSWLESRGEPAFIVHRIDKDTSGLLIVAKNAEAHRYYNGLFEKRNLRKTYYGLVSGLMSGEDGVYDQPIEEHPGVLGKMRVGRKGKPATTQFQVAEKFRGFTWVKFQIETGRTHQIRVHSQNAGYPIVCDPIYGSPAPVLLSSFKKRFKLSKADEEERPLVARLALHAYSLGLTDQNGQEREFFAPLAKDLDAALKQFRKWAC